MWEISRWWVQRPLQGSVAASIRGESNRRFRPMVTTIYTGGQSFFFRTRAKETQAKVGLAALYRHIRDLIKDARLQGLVEGDGLHMIGEEGQEISLHSLRGRP